MKTTTLAIIFIIIFIGGFNAGQLLKKPQKQEVHTSDVACNQYRLDAIYYKNNFEKCIDNNIADSYKNVK